MKIDDFPQCPFCLKDLIETRPSNSGDYVRKICTCGGETTVFVVGANVLNREVEWLSYTFDPIYIMINIPNSFGIYGNIGGNTLLRVDETFPLPDPYDTQNIEKRIKLYLTFS